MDKQNEKIINLWDKVAAKFGKVGPKYWNTFGERLVELSSISSGSRVLDIGMGRGASLFPAIEKSGVGGYVIGIDSSEIMVNETRKDILSRRLLNAEVKNMNAQFLDFEKASFDNVICGFGLGYLLFSETKLNGVLQMLKKSGQVGFSIWGVQEDQKWLTKIVNRYLPQNQNNNGQRDILKFDTADDVREILKDSGFNNIKIYEEASEVIYSDKEEWWQEMYSNAVCGIFERIEELGIDTYERFKVEISIGLEKYYKDGKLRFNMPVIYAFGEK